MNKSGKNMQNPMARDLRQPKYKQQVMGCMMITGAKWWDLMAYSDKKPHHLIIRVERDEEYIEKLAAEIDKAVTIIINETEKLA